MAIEKRWVIKDADGNVLNEFEGVANQDFVGQDFDGVIVASVEQTDDVTVPDVTPTAEEVFRKERNRILKETDWTQMPDSPLTDTKKQEWATYRQQLRDLPANTTDPSNPTWPTQPS